MNKLNKNYLSIHELKKIGFKKIGKNSKISKNIITHSAQIDLGDNVRIDDGCILKGNIKFGNNVHLGHNCILGAGSGKISLDDFAAISANTLFFTNSDDYVKPFLPSATLNNKQRSTYSKIYQSDIKIGKACLVGAGSVLLPGSHMEDFSSIGALTILFKKINKGYFYSSHPHKLIKRDWAKMKKKLDKFYNIK